jgi:hypothetical protein
MPSAYCIPADLNFDGFLEVTCSASGSSYMFYSNVSNQNPTITSVAFDTGTTIAVGTTLYAYVTAYDVEGDGILYIYRCSDTSSFTNASGSSTGSCVYNSVGDYNFTIGVRDVYHSTYNYFSQIISVTQTGQICNNNGICETGENYNNCPNDCPSPPLNYTQVQGGMAIPTKLVDTENTEQGLLPEIYYGTLGFFSSVLSPTIILVFAIFFVFIILAIGMIIVRIGKKVANIY